MKACVLISHFRVRVEMSRNADLKDRPVVIVDRRGGRPLVVDSSAKASGVAAGMTLEDALSRHTNTTILDTDEPHYQKAFDPILGSLQNISDRVEKADLGVAYVDFDGLEAMYGGEDSLLQALLESVPADLNPRVGVADSKFVAFIAARAGQSGQICKVSSDAESTDSFLAPFSIGLLPISLDAKIRLHRFGMDVMGDIASMKLTFLIDQFGQEGKLIWELCNGIDYSSIVPLKYEENILEYMSLPFYSTSIEVLRVAIDTLLKRAYMRPQMRTRYAAKATLECNIFNSSTWKKSISFKQGVGSWDNASFIIKSQLDIDAPQAPFEDVTLTLSDFTKETGTQIALLQDNRKDKRADLPPELLEAEQRLRAKMGGLHALHKVVEVAPWHPVPEMRALQVPIDPSGNETVKSFYNPVRISVKEGQNHRPLAFCTGKLWHQIGRIEDMWMFDLWWLPKPIERTYFHVTRHDGRQVTLFRDQGDDSWYQQSY